MAAESLLRPLLGWNKEAFPDDIQERLWKQMESVLRDGRTLASQHDITMKGQESRYRSKWQFHQKAYKVAMPVSRLKRKEAVAAVVASARSRCMKARPGSLLIHDLTVSTGRCIEEGESLAKINHAKEWSLMKDSEGFGAKVMACFMDRSAKRGI